MKKKTPVVPDEERQKKSVYYDSCTSAFKDDFPTLVACLRSDKGDPHTRQEAGFLLWHHALEGDDVAGLLSAGVVPACIANLDTPPSGLLPAERACSAGILLTLAADNEDVSEQLVRSRAPSGRSALEVLHWHLREDAAMSRQHCCRLLQLLAKQVPHAMLRAMDNHLPYLPAYLAVWDSPDHKDAPVVVALSSMVALLIQERAELAEAVVAAGGVETLLRVLRVHKSEAACSGALALLTKLLPVEGAAGQLVRRGAVAVLVDLIGPPPRLVLPPEPDLEPSAQPELQLPDGPASPGSRAANDSDGGGGGSGSRGSQSGGRASDGAELQGGEERASASTSVPAAAASAGTSGDSDGGGSPRNHRASHRASGDTPTSPQRAAGSGTSGSVSLPLAGTARSSSVSVRVQLPLVIPGIHSPAAGSTSSSPQRLRAVPSTLGAEASSISVASHLSLATSAASPAAAFSSPRASVASLSVPAAGVDSPVLPAPRPPPADLATNHCGLRWFMLPGLEVASLAVACLCMLVQLPECLAEAEYRLASHRILAQVKAVMAAASSAAGAVRKGKKKGLGLTPEQTAGLTRLLGLMKFLSLTNTTRYRVGKLGAVPSLVRLYGEGTDYLLRTHCQAILSNAALLAENGQALKEGKIPEEFLVANPMRLTAQERAVLRLEFPDEPALAA